MCAIVDNRTNPVLCAKHATREHRKIISRGQCKYTIDVDFKIIKAKAIVMVENERNNHEYNILFCVQSEFSMNINKTLYFKQLYRRPGESGGQ